MKNISISSLFVLLSIFASAQNISFFSEYLSFKLDKDFFEVDGLYYFRNATDQDVSQILFYPFPDVEKYGSISYIHIHAQNDTASMLVAEIAKGAMFNVQIPPKREIAYRICYRQKLISNQAMYIITTTRNWAKPFENAKYWLEFPESIILDNISMQPDSVANSDGKVSYFWEKADFMPGKDFIFNFSEN